MDCTEAFAVPGQNNIIDVIHPKTGRSWINGNTLEEMQKRYPAAIKVNCEEFFGEVYKRNNGSVTWSEETREQYDYAFECLSSPIMFGGGNFMVNEPSDHFGPGGVVRYYAHVERSGKCYASNRALTKTQFKEILSGAVKFEIV